MDNELKEILGTIVSRLGSIENKVNVIEDKVNAIEERQTRLEIIIETDISKKISVLFDAHEVTHEKLFEINQKLERNETRIETLEVKAM